MAVVYKITRNDDLAYIGIAVDFNARLAQHRRSRRFNIGIKSFDILFEGDWIICAALEPKFIQEYNTFYGGLNVTATGKGKNLDCNFNTYGFIFSKESRKKMSESARLRGAPSCCGWNKGKKMNYSTKPGVEGSGHPNSKLTEAVVREIISLYVSRPVMEQEGIIGRNGRPLSYDWAFSTTYAIKYNVSPTLIRLIIQKKAWNHVWSEYSV